MVRALLFCAASTLLFLGCGGGDEDKPVDLCTSLEPCMQVGCTTCDWPEGSCRIDQEEIFSIDLPSQGNRPYTVLLDILVSSVMRCAEDEVCTNPEIVIDSPQGEFLREALRLDENRSICLSSSQAGRHTVSLLCPHYPTRAGYRVSVVDATGRRVPRF
jgi:hypothetical protein